MASAKRTGCSAALIPIIRGAGSLGGCEHDHVHIGLVAGTVGVNPVSNTQGKGTLRAHARISGLLMATLESWCETEPSRRDKRPLTKQNESREFGTLLDSLSGTWTAI